MYNQFVLCELLNLYITSESSWKNEVDRRHKMMSSKFGFRSRKCNHDWHQVSALITGWIRWKFYDISGPCVQTQCMKEKDLHRNSFPTDILSS